MTTARVSLPDRYRVVRHLANGGMASVWEAHDDLLDRAVAVKLLAPHLSEDERACKRFQREARAAAGLSSHPNVVTIYDVGEHDGRVFMVMELMRGGSVADRLAPGGRIAHETALRWLREAAGALDTAHAAGIVHRDIKPANLLLDERDRLAMADFGIARLAWEDQVTATGQVLGTAAYISPEQAMGEPATAASDRYSLAVVAFELLTGGKPFVAEHFAAQARAHVEDPPPAASDRAPGLPRRVDDVLGRGLAKEPSDRFGSAAEMVGALGAALGDSERTAPTRRMPRRTRAAAAAVPAPAAAAADRRSPPAAPRQSTASRRQAAATHRRTGMVLFGALGALLLLAVLGFALLGGNSNRQGQRAPKRTATTTAHHRRTPTATPTAKATQTATPTPTATATPTQSPAPTSPPATSGNPSALEREGHSLLAAGKSQQAAAVLARAVAACKGSTAVDPCAYAMYDYADALVRSGHPAQAIPILQERLRRFHNQDDVVRALLARATAAAGQGTPAPSPSGPGKGHGKGKGKD